MLAAQRGLVGLRGCAVTRDGRARLLLGPAACGKSSFAALLEHQGFQVMSDGWVCLERRAGRYHVYPGRTSPVLWSDAFARSGSNRRSFVPLRPMLASYVRDEALPELRSSLLTGITILPARGGDLRHSSPYSETVRGRRAWQAVHEYVVPKLDEATDRHFNLLNCVGELNSIILTRSQGDAV